MYIFALQEMRVLLTTSRAKVSSAKDTPAWLEARNVSWLKFSANCRSYT